METGEKFSGSSAEEGGVSHEEGFEEVEALKAVQELANLEKKLDQKEIQFDSREEKQKFYEDLTESQFLITHYIETMGDRREELRNFWNRALEQSQETGVEREFRMLKSGVLSQVAAMYILEQAGMRPSLAKPKEDAFSKIDLWIDEANAVQVKGGAKIERPRIVAADRVSLPVVEVEYPKRGQARPRMNQFTTSHHREFSRFFARVQEYGDVVGRDISAYLLEIPNKQIDYITGRPEYKLVKWFADRLKRLGLEGGDK